MKLGLDFHGVITDDPRFFAKLSEMYISGGHEVHIITGRRITQDFKNILDNRKIKYTHLFSICDFHLQEGTPMTGYEEGQPKIDDTSWDCTKGHYCEIEGIDLHIDDSDVYGDYFLTPYLKYTPKNKD